LQAVAAVFVSEFYIILDFLPDGLQVTMVNNIFNRSLFCCGTYKFLTGRD
jgi:hypothetical protein